jgi:hypothetical protein
MKNHSDNVLEYEKWRPINWQQTLLSAKNLKIRKPITVCRLL